MRDIAKGVEDCVPDADRKRCRGSGFGKVSELRGVSLSKLGCEI